MKKVFPIENVHFRYDRMGLSRNETEELNEGIYKDNWDIYLITVAVYESTSINCINR